MSNSEIDAKEKCPAYCTSLGNYNHLPEPFAPCDIGEFWYEYFSYGTEVEFRQCEPPWIENKGPFCIRSCRIFWFHDVAYAVFTPDKWDSNGADGALRYVDTPRCYRIGCKHKWTHTTIRMHEHMQTCAKCGISFSYDSSG